MKKKFYYSEKQRQRSIDMAESGALMYEFISNRAIAVPVRAPRNFCKLQDGRVVEYTECSSLGVPIGNWDDYVFLGEGEYHHTENL